MTDLTALTDDQLSALFEAEYRRIADGDDQVVLVLPARLAMALDGLLTLAMKHPSVGDALRAFGLTVTGSITEAIGGPVMREMQRRMNAAAQATPKGQLQA
jgi:hypothetical protein